MTESQSKPGAVNLKLTLLPDMSTAAIRFVDDAGREVCGGEVDAIEIESMIARLAHVRARMTPAVPHGRPDDITGRILQSVTEFFAGINAFDGNPAISFRTPGLGWFGFSLSFEKAEELGSKLLGARKMAADLIAQKKTN